MSPNGITISYVYPQVGKNSFASTVLPAKFNFGLKIRLEDQSFGRNGCSSELFTFILLDKRMDFTL